MTENLTEDTQYCIDKTLERDSHASKLNLYSPYISNLMI